MYSSTGTEHPLKSKYGTTVFMNRTSTSWIRQCVQCNEETAQVLAWCGNCYKKLYYRSASDIEIMDTIIENNRKKYKNSKRQLRFIEPI